MDWMSIYPALCLIAAGLLAVGVDLFLGPKSSRAPLAVVCMAGIVGALGLALRNLMILDEPIVGFWGAVVLDPLTTCLTIAICLGTALLVALSPVDSQRRDMNFGEYYALVLLSAGSMVMLVSSNDFVMLFLNIEIMSLAMYVLTGLTRRNPRSNEAAVKYLVTGAFATGFLLMGMTFLYGITGSMNLQVLGEALSADTTTLLLPLGVGLLLIGLLFKVGAVPFHMWVPDVYEGAPTSTTAFMAVAVKAAAFGALIRVVYVALPELPGIWMSLLWVLSAATMIVGNVLAVQQQSVKRMLAYSGIAHTGYALIGLVALYGTDGQVSADALEAVVFYLIVYTFMTLGAFAFLVYMGHEVTHPDGETVEWQDAESLDDLAGLATRRPWAALAMAIFMVSLAGIPPTAGFFGKFYLFGAAVAQGHVLLVIVGVLASLVSLYYYMRVIIYMYMKEDVYTDERPSIVVGLVVAVAAVLTIVSGVQPGALLELAAMSMGQ